LPLPGAAPLFQFPAALKLEVPKASEALKVTFTAREVPAPEAITNPAASNNL